MTFLIPLGFLALLALPVIIWLHLRRGRLRRVIVPSLMLWHNLPKPPQSQKRRWLPITLLLFIHLLIATLLSIALAQPNLVAWKFQKRHHLAIIIDTSTSMQTQDTAQGTRLEAARHQARQLTNSLGPQDSFTLISAGTHAHKLASGDTTNQASMLATLDTLHTKGTGTDFDNALTIAQTTLKADPEGRPYDEGRIVVLTDLDQPQTATPIDEAITWKRLGRESSNRAVVALAARPRANNRSAGHHLYARVANYGNDMLTTHLRLYGDDTLLDTKQVVFYPEGEVDLTWDLPANVRIVRADLDGQDALPIDDSASLSLNQERSTKTLLVSDTPETLEHALSAIPGLNIVPIDSQTYPLSPLVQTADLIVFDSTLTQTLTWPSGGIFVINPPAQTALLQVEPPSMPQKPLEIQDYGHALTSGLNLGSVDFGPVASLQVPVWGQTLLSINDDIPLIVRGRTAQSEIAIWTFNLQKSNAATKLAFPILVARTVRDLIPPPLPESLTAGELLTLHPDPRADTIEVHSPTDQVWRWSVAANTSPIRVDDMTQPGLYKVIERKGNDVLYQGQVAVNTGIPQESDLRPRPAANVPTLQDQPDAPGAAVAAQEAAENIRQPLWVWVVLITLCILFLEWVYSAGYRERNVHNRRPSTPPKKAA